MAFLPFPGWFGDPECAPHTRFPSREEPWRFPTDLTTSHPQQLGVPSPHHPGPGHTKAAQRFFMTSVTIGAPASLSHGE